MASENSACCHASGSVGRYALVQIGEHEPLQLCRHCFIRHAPELIRIGAIAEAFAGVTYEGDSDAKGKFWVGEQGPELMKP